MAKHIRRVRKCKHTKAVLVGYQGASSFSGWISARDSKRIYWCSRCGSLAVLSEDESILTEKFTLPMAFQRIVIEDED